MKAIYFNEEIYLILFINFSNKIINILIYYNFSCYSLIYRQSYIIRNNNIYYV